MKSLVQLFENNRIRTLFDQEKHELYFSVADVCGALTNQPNARGASNYWAKLKQRLCKEENQLLTNCQQLKMPAEDGRMRATDALCTKDILRLVQEIPSKKAKQFRIWIAKIAVEKIAEKRQARIASAEETETIAVKARKKRKMKRILWILGVAAGLGIVILAAVIWG